MIKKNKKIEDIRIREAEEKDIYQIYNINKIIFEEDKWSYEEFEKLFKIKEDLYLILVAENLKGDATQICGFVIGKVVEDEGEVLKIGVDLAFQGRGIGRKLFENLLFKFRQRGVKKVYLEVRKSNKRAINLYKSLNFRKIGERKRYYRKEDALIFVYEFLYL